MTESLDVLHLLFSKFYPTVEVNKDSNGLTFTSNSKTIGVKDSGSQLVLVTKDQGSKAYDFSQVSSEVMLSVFVPIILSHIDGIQRV